MAIALFLIGGISLSGMSGIAAAKDFALGDIPLDKETYEKHIKELPKDRLELLEALPSSYDARHDGIVTSPKNQGSCGSCWAFASVGAFESHLLKKYGAGPYDLSEQQLLDCNPYGYSCSGGSSNAPRYWESTGSVTETCYPYTAIKGSCSYSCTEMVYRVTGWHTVAQTTWNFKDSCYNEGPGYWRFTVYDDFYDFWYGPGDGSVYVHTSGYYLGGHAVLLIGWDDTKNAYLCKNSWGEYGGPNDDGTFWIAYSGHANNLESTFGMANFDVTGGSVGSCPDCSDGIVNLQNVTFPAGRTCQCNATSITVGTGVTIPSTATVEFNASSFITISNGSGLTIPNGATVTFTAPTITVQPGFHTESGAVVNMRQP